MIKIRTANQVKELLEMDRGGCFSCPEFPTRFHFSRDSFREDSNYDISFIYRTKAPTKTGKTMSAWIHLSANFYPSLGTYEICDSTPPRGRQLPEYKDLYHAVIAVFVSVGCNIPFDSMRRDDT